MLYIYFTQNLNIVSIGVSEISQSLVDTNAIGFNKDRYK